ncbi:polymer-forming cytoskeletal protein [Zunongwangia sp. H14]|uniref:bactofilin family protein n=1 Tax=Zunongwangia sp. H14 TaxID=3240792 RepID=UPI0035658AC0
MFSDQKRLKSTSEAGKDQNRIAAGTLIKGEITGKGAFRIEGTLEGNLTTQGKVVIGKGGIINGKLECENADVEGRITGNLHVKEVLSLRSSAIIDGEVTTGKLAVEPGAKFNASCAMHAGIKSISKNDEKRSA